VQPRLTVISGPDQGQTYALVEGQSLVLGRGESASIQLSDATVSRSHCRVEFGGGKFRLSDLGSRAGTLVNGQPATQHELSPGDVIHLGATEMRFELEATNRDTTIGMKRPVQSAGPADGAAAPAPAAVSLAKLVGARIATFEIQAKVAVADSGVVFRAYDAEHNRTVALKVLNRKISQDEESVQRFVRAMKTVMPIRHPNLVQVYLAGKTGPRCWAAMEFVEGENMAQVIRRIGTVGMLDWRYSFRVAVHVGRALEEAARHDMIHRNITPTNILVRTSDQCVKLGDLMLAKALSGAQGRRVTRPGRIVGEMLSLSPERTFTDGAVDGRSDIYSLGATLYALLTGRPPFEGGPVNKIITQIREVQPERPKKYQLAIPDMFEGLVLRMLAKRPDDRHQTATELLADLERVGRYQGLTV
jgi:serine/threonine protein kinase